MFRAGFPRCFLRPTEYSIVREGLLADAKRQLCARALTLHTTCASHKSTLSMCFVSRQLIPDTPGFESERANVKARIWVHDDFARHWRIQYNADHTPEAVSTPVGFNLHNLTVTGAIFGMLPEPVIRERVLSSKYSIKGVNMRMRFVEAHAGLTTKRDKIYELEVSVAALNAPNGFKVFSPNDYSESLLKRAQADEAVRLALLRVVLENSCG